MRDAAVKGNDIERIQAWAGQSAGMARTEPAGEVVRRLWEEAEAASHNLKLILDAIFGVQDFTSEIIWQRTTPKGLGTGRVNPLWLDLDFAAVARIW